MSPPPLPPRPGVPSFHPAYRPFSGAQGEIRLLVLEPAADFDAPLICALQHAQLDSNPHYEAVSYTWGLKSHGFTIRLDGHIFSVFESVDAALRRLRLKSEPRTLWMDAICINQDDNSEKNIQVPLMRQIYEQAHQVCAYVGETKDEMFHMVISSFKPGSTKDDIITFGVINYWARLTVNNMFKKNPLVNRFNIFNVHDSYLAAEARLGEVRELLSRPWWTRAWIIQEVVLAKRLTLICGDEAFGWDLARSMVAGGRADQCLGDDYNILSCPEQSALFARFEAMDDLRQTWIDHPQKIILLEILYNFRAQSCTDPRDRIYSFLGLARMSGITVDPDYDLPAVDVYLSFARAVVEKTKSLDILNCKREWRGVKSPSQQTYAYNIWDQVKYHDTQAMVKRDGYKKPTRGWAQLPPGWECIVKEDESLEYRDHNTGVTQNVSPLKGLPPPPAKHPSEYRICPEGWVKEWDNVGRCKISYRPDQSSMPGELSSQDTALIKDLELSRLSSWAPNWAGANHYDPKPLLYQPTATGEDLLYYASGDIPAILHPTDDPNALCLGGIFFDTITSLSERYHPIGDTPPMWLKPHDPRTTWETLALSPDHPNPYPSLAAREEAFHRLHLADFLPSHPFPIPTPALLGAVPPWRTASSEGRFDDGLTLSGLANMSFGDFCKEVVTSEYGETIRQQGWEVAAERIHRVTAHRALCVTKEGWLGLVPWNARVGDTVWVLRGGRTPFLLRARTREGGEEAGEDGGEEEFELVGECYVQGIMAGEAMVMGREDRVLTLV